MLYSLVDLRFLKLGNNVFWYPVVLVVFDIIEAVFWAFSSHFAYIRHQVS